MALRLPDHLAERLAAVVAERTGLAFVAGRRRDLEAGIGAAARASGASDLTSYAQHLLATPWTRELVQAVAPHLTVGETYFFRDLPALDALAELLVARLLAADRDGGRPTLRVWSAGCATGEEPYSLAMLLDRLLAGALEHISIHGSDVDLGALRAAEAGVYRPWSLRGAPKWALDQYFTLRGDGTYELQPRIRERVSFSYLNLAGKAYPSPATRTVDIDLLLCRNVLMYFAPDRAGEVFARFAEALAPDGMLLLGPAETASPPFEPRAPAVHPEVVLYRRAASARRPARRGSGPERPTPAGSHAFPPPSPPPARRRADPSLAETARALADRGRLDDAATWCRRAVRADRHDPAHRYLLATIECERGRTGVAVELLRQALRLDPGLVVAHVAMANLLVTLARPAEAERHLSEASALLSDHDGATVIPESGGLTAGALAEIVHAIRASDR